MQIGDVELEVVERGKGRPLLLLHGSDHITPEERFIAALAISHRVILPTHPGFGRAALPDWLDSIDDVAHLYLALLHRMNIKHLDIVGFGIGGWVAAEMATTAFDLVRRLVLVAPVGIKTGPVDRLDVPDIFAKSEDELARLMFHDSIKHRPNPSVMSDEQVALMVRNRETLALLTWEPYMHSTKLKHRLPLCKAKALLIRGESDGLVSSEYLRAYADRIPQSQTMTIAEAGHMPHIEQPEELARSISRFLTTESRIN